MNPEQYNQFQKLVLSFPVLRGHHQPQDGHKLPGLDPWEPHRLDDWAWNGRSTAEVIAVQFVLAVFNRHVEWRIGKFDIITAGNTLIGTDDWFPILTWLLEATLDGRGDIRLPGWKIANVEKADLK